MDPDPNLLTMLTPPPEPPSPPPSSPSYQGYSTWVADVIALCLSPDPSHRPSSEVLLQGANTRLWQLATYSNMFQQQQQQ